MAVSIRKLLFTLCLVLPLLAVCQCDENENYLDIESPNFFNYNSPLKQPDSLRSRPYFDFLSTLYRHDTTKSDLFRPYLRQRRDAPTVEAAAVPAVLDVAAIAPVQPEVRQKRAILFRPLFVYKQQQVRRQEAAKRRKRV